MKAIQFNRFGDESVLMLGDLADPRPGPGEVLINIEAATITPGDWRLREGELQHIFPVTFPCIPGRDGAGTITATGTDVDYARIGDRVCFIADRTRQGSYAEKIVRDAASIVPLPPGFSFAQGAALAHAGTCAWIALVETAWLQKGQKILIHAGAGAIGGMALQLAKHLGAYVATTCSANNESYVRQLGADQVLAYDRVDFSTQLHDYDVVLDLIGADVHHRSYTVLKEGGVLVWLKGLPIVDRSSEFKLQVTQAMIHDEPHALAAVMELAAAGALAPQVSRLMPLSEAAQAQRLVQHKQNSRGRIVLDIHGQAASVQPSATTAP